MNEYLVVIEHQDESWGAYCPDLPGLGVTGTTREEVEQPVTKALSAQKVQITSASAHGASRDRTGDLLLAKQISLSTRVSWCLEKPCKSGCSVGHGGTRQDGARQSDAPLVHPRRGVRLGGGSRAAVEGAPG
jgi:hypothetical protein